MIKTSDKDNTKTIIGLGFLTVFLLMILVTWLSMSRLQAVNTSMSTLIESADQKTTLAYQMRDAIRLRSGAVRTLVQTEDITERQRIFKQLSDYTSRYSTAKNNLIEQAANDRHQRVLSDVADADKRVAEAYHLAGKEIGTTKLDITVLRSALNSVNLQELVLLNHLNDLVELERQLAKEALQKNQLQYRDTQKLLLIIIGAAFALSIIISATVITRVARANSKIAHLANHDDLTGLHNRRSFEQHLAQAIAVAGRSENAQGLLYLDLDRFKIVNDTCGHHAGDQLLIQLTGRMQQRLRRGDLFARVGGDEFAIIAQGKSFSDIQQLAEELRVIVSEFEFNYEQQSFKVSLSIGVAPIDGQTSSIEQVLADVDSACYVAKQSGRNRVHITQDDDIEIVQYRSNLAGIQAIRKALSDQRLTLFYQPVHQLADDSAKIAHCEILLRIRSENGEVYSPARFIPIAEKYNVMNEIDQWVFNNIVEWLVENQAHHDIPRLLINLSGMSFADDDFSKYIVERLQKGDVNPAHIAFEISEGAAVRNFNKVMEFVNKIRALGCELALDDFGSGFSSFNYLKQLPIDYIKIDGSLVRDIANNEVDRKMVDAINQIGHTVGARTIAEFVEDNAALECLKSMNVDFAQGYGLGMPTPLSQLTKNLCNAGSNTSDSSEQSQSNSNAANDGHRPGDRDDSNDNLRHAS
ncbi:MAG: EAL domain-containing protein [Granulosicoccus sp.]|nr:EAL domain-containing protein [Granulosicoccus sp.]